MKLLSFFKNKSIKHPSELDLLVQKGLVLGNNVSIQNDVIIDPSHCWLISIGDECTIAPRVIILAHDASMKRHLGYTKIGKVVIGNKTFIGAGSIILPNVTIGDNVVIGAGSVVTKNIPSGVVAIGNPAEIICNTSDFVSKHADAMKHSPTFSWEGWTLGGGITEENKETMKLKLEKTFGYVE